LKEGLFARIHSLIPVVGNMEASAQTVEKKKIRKSFWESKWPLLLVVLYVLSPIDLLPGGLDDSVVVALEIIRQISESKKKK